MNVMEPVDKFGRKINLQIFNRLCNIGLKLNKLGYKESKRKPNLFYRKFEGGFIFADMRGTEMIPIWESPEPIIDFKFDSNIQEWQQVRIREKELEMFRNNIVPWRFTYEEDEHWMDWDREKIYWHNIFGDSDGFCKCCGKDMKNNNYFCSEECKEIAIKKQLARQINNSDEFCYVCKTKKISSKQEIKDIFDVELPDVLLNHHVSYFPEKTIPVCRKCHNLIHKTDNYPDLKPDYHEIRKFYAPKVLD